jgi:hypothetical protein
VKFYLVPVLLLLALYVYPQAQVPEDSVVQHPEPETPAAVWERAFSTLSQKECEEIINVTNLGLTMQSKSALWQISEIPAAKPFLGLYQYKNGDFLFVIAGPFYTSAAYYSIDGSRSPLNFLSYGEYLTAKMKLDPKYIGIDSQGLYKQAESK